MKVYGKDCEDLDRKVRELEALGYKVVPVKNRPVGGSVEMVRS